MSTSDIYNAITVNDTLLLSGQPTEDQLRDAESEQFTSVINLATYHPQRSLPDEAGLVKSLGMTYHHIPVDWGNPTVADFAKFENLMVNMPTDEKVLVHCAANFRVTAFYSLYAQKHLGWSAEQAENFRAKIWAGSDDPVWEQFIRDVGETLNG
ncbi:MAG: protein tyrosine phosphatase family protein [Anaerolineae bacterium]|nr:protein tyrosine phosphatase family protein [Anaerolineae bacterium]